LQEKDIAKSVRTRWCLVVNKKGNLNAAIIGHPVEHSLSPQIFKFLGRQLGKDLDYIKKDILPVELVSFFEEKRSDINFVGCNVTIPHKETIIKLLEKTDSVAEIIGAVNVVKKQGNEFLGYNSDTFGVTESLGEAGVDIRGEKVLVLGAGGAARAGIYSACFLGAREISIVNRTKERAKSLVAHFQRHFPDTKFKIMDWETKLPDDARLYINATSVGLAGNLGHFLFPLKFSNHPIGFDMVYGARPTLFEEEMTKLGLRCIDGFDMLTWQAIKTFEIWFEKIEHPMKVKVELKEFIH